MMKKGAPDVPEPTAIALDRMTTAVLVLDLGTRCDDPGTPCGELLPTVGKFLERARAGGVSIVFSLSLRDRGTSLGVVASTLKRRENETIIYPNSFDKFFGGELRDALQQRGANNLVITGAATNVAVMYTTTTAVRVYKYHVVIPVDGVIAASHYEQEYALHQLHALPAGSITPVRFSTLPAITFQ
jgi:nicotinamidase-related amidase